MYHRINSRQDQVSYVTSKQRLTPEEEGSLQSWVNQSYQTPPFDKISAKPYTDDDTLPSASTLIQTRYISGQISPISGNIVQVSEVEEFILLFRHQTLDSSKLTLLQKTIKAARLAMTDRIVLNRTNTELLAANTRKKQRAQRTGTQYDVQGARVLSLEDVEKRRQLAENKKKEKDARSQVRKEKQNDRLFFQVSKDLMRFEPDLIYVPDLVTS